MIQSEYYMPSSDGKTLLFVRQWTPRTMPLRGVVQIEHGISEHGGRYDRVAKRLCGRGYLVVAEDRLGHGHSAVDGHPLGYTGEVLRWWNMVEDTERLRRYVSSIYPQLPYCLMGHSMGSFVVRSHLIHYPNRVDGAILCGTTNQSLVKLAAGKAVLDREIRRYGRAGCSVRMYHLILGHYNRKISDCRTNHDWLAADPNVVDDYLRDSLCGKDLSLGLYRDMLEGVEDISIPSHLKKMDKTLPVLLLSGGDDPVGDFGRGVQKVCDAFRRAGMQDVSCKLYHGLRHEVLRDKGSRYVCEDILTWLDSHVK